MTRFACALVSSMLLSVCSAGTVDSRPNILLIVADDLGYSDLGSYGGEIETPWLDRLAAEGIRLTAFYAAPTCSPTRAMLMSGTDPHLVGLATMAEVLSYADHVRGKPGYEGYLAEEAHSLPRLLRKGGYATYMAGKWHLGIGEGREPDDWGFDRSFALLHAAASHFKPLEGSTVRVENAAYREDGKPVELPDDFYSTAFYTDKLIDYIESGRESGRPFFAYAAYTAPHWPLHAPDEYIGKYRGRYDAGYAAVRRERLDRMRDLGLTARDFEPAKRADTRDERWHELTAQERRIEARKMEVYAAMVDRLDAGVGRLLTYLRESGQYDDTLIVFISDNGAAGENHLGYSPSDERTDNALDNIGRRGSNVNYGLRWAEVSATPLRLFKGSTAEGGISVPAIVRLPGGGANAGGIVRRYGRVDDLLPTFLALAGLPRPDGSERDKRPVTGRSLLPLLRGRSGAPQPTIAGELFGQAYVRKGPWKLVSARVPEYSMEAMTKPYRWQLFNVVGDRGETDDVASEYPAIVDGLRDEWRDYVEWTRLVEPAPAGAGSGAAPDDTAGTHD